MTDKKPDVSALLEEGEAWAVVDANYMAHYIEKDRKKAEEIAAEKGYSVVCVIVSHG